MICSNSTTIGAGPHVLTFHLAGSRPELWPTFYAPVQQTAAWAGASTTLNQKQSGFEAKTLCVVPEGVESLLLDVELVARLPTSGQ